MKIESKKKKKKKLALISAGVLYMCGIRRSEFLSIMYMGSNFCGCNPDSKFSCTSIINDDISCAMKKFGAMGGRISSRIALQCMEYLLGTHTGSAH
jgi:hypothetical protein